MLSRIERAAASLCRFVAIVGLLILLAFAAVSVADGVMREFMKQPIDLVRDIGGLVVAIAIGCCMPAGLMLRCHISVRFLESVAGRRAGLYLDALTAILVTATMAAIANEFIAFADKTRIGGQATFLLHLPTWPYWYVVTAIFCFAAFVQVIVMIVMIARLFGPVGGDTAPTHDSAGMPL